MAAPPLFGPAPIPTGDPQALTLPQRRPLLAPRALSQGEQLQAFNFGAQQAAQASEQPASAWDQVSGLVAGLPQGIADLGVQGVQSVAGFPRLASDVAQHALGVGEGFNDPNKNTGENFTQNLGDYFPLLETFRGSFANTGQDVLHPERFKEASDKGQLVSKLVEDAANASILAAPLAKGLTALSGAERAGAAGAADATAEGAAQASRFTPRFVGPEAVDAATATRPGFLRAAQTVENLAKPAETVAGAPARVWTAPLMLAKGFELPSWAPGALADDGTPRQFGVKPLLDQTGVTQRVVDSPLGQTFADWRDKRAMLKDVRESQLLPGSAQVHVAADDLNRMLAPARKILGDDAELMDANHLVHTGMGPNLEVLRSLRDQLPAEQLDDLVAQTFGRERAPTERTIDLATDYVNGRLDPELAGRMDKAWQYQKRALDMVEQMKLDEGTLNPEQTGRAPMESKTAPILGGLQDRANQLRDYLYGTSVNGVHTPGLADEAGAARAAIPEPDMGQLAGQRAQAAARRAGAVEREAVLAAKQEERASAGEAAAGERADQARLGTLQGAREAMGRLQQDRYGMGGYEPEWARGQQLIGETERAGGPPPAGGYQVPDDELALAQQINRLEGHARTAPVERVLPGVARAQDAATRGQQAAAEAAGRVFTGAAAPVLGPAAGELPFGAAAREPVGPMTDRDAVQYVRQVRSEAVQRVEQRLADLEGKVASVMDGPVDIPRPGSPMSDAWDQIRNELGRYVQNMKINGERLFKRSARPSGAAGGMVEGAAIGRADSLDAFLDRYDPGSVNVNDALEAFIHDAQAIQELRQQRGAIMRDGLDDPGLIAETERERAALTGDLQSAAQGVKSVHTAEVLPEAEHGPSPWTMNRADYIGELGNVQEHLSSVRDLPYEQWPAEVVQAERRLLDLTPEVLGDTAGMSADALYDRIRDQARTLGREVPPEPAEWIHAGEAGHTALEESRMMAQDAADLDAGTRARAAAEGRPVNPAELIWTQLTPDEKVLYRSLKADEAAGGAQDRLDATRGRVTEPIRVEGERAGARLGAAQGQEALLGRQADVAGRRAETLAPQIDETAARAQQVAEQEAARPLRFGERRGKLIRDAQVLERELRTKEGRLSWLEDEKIPAEQARLAEGPREVAPGAYVPALVTGERLKAALQQMGDTLAEQTGDWTMGGRFWKEMSDVPATMNELHARGVLPEYLPGAVDVPTKGTPTLAGSQEQLPWEHKTPSQYQKQYGHVPQQIRTVQRSLINEIRGIVENRTAQKMRDEIATPGHELLDELVQRGELSPLVADRLRAGSYDRSVDLAKEMERHGYTAWDPGKPQLPGDRYVTADSHFLPTPIANEFQRWWKPASRNPAILGYDLLTRGFKHSVLALSPTWNINNVLGNAFMAVVFGGESPLEIYRRSREVLASSREAGHEQRLLAPEEPTRTQRVMEAVPGGQRLREWGKDIAAAPALGPPRLYGAGGAAEISRQFAEEREPATVFGRGVNQMYRLNETVDNIGRNALYLAKKGRGYTDEEAVAQALNAMGDFNNKTPFERDVVRRIIPFYAWMKHVTQASYHLAVEHPFRTAWLLHVSDLFNPDQGGNLPDWLRGSIALGHSGWSIPMGGANPLQGNFGSVFTAGHDWPGELMRGLNPLIKLGAAGVGINLQTRRPITGPPGSGPVDQYGKPVFGLQTPSALAYMAARMVPQGRMLEDLVQQPVLRYDTGQVVKSKGQTIPLQGGRFGQVLSDLRLPFFPSYTDQAAAAQRIAKGRAALAKARAGYNR